MPDYSDIADLQGGYGMSPTEKSDWWSGIFTATRHVECAWADRTAVFNALIATEYPYIPSTGAYAMSGEMRGWGKSSNAGGGMVAYEKARVTLHYDNKIRRVGDLWLTEELLPSAQFRQLDSRSFCWDDKDGVALRDGEAPAMRQVFLDYKVTFYKLLALPTAILTHIGACNNAPFASYTLGIVFPTETLLLVEPPARRDLQFGFLSGWQLTYHFRFLPSGANTWWRPETNSWESIYHTKGSGRYIQHPLMNFNLLVP